MSDYWVVVAYPTIMDGLVLRWYRDVTGAERGEERMSASRDGVLINCYLHEIPDLHLAAARLTHERLRYNRESGRQEVLAFATHSKGLLGGKLTPIVRASDPEPSS